MSELTNKQFLEELASIDALRFGDFTLASGAKSKFYLDLRYLPAYPGIFKNLMYRLISDIIDDLKYDVIIGIPTAGIPFSSSLATILDKPTQILRKKPKEHGRKQQIEGPELDGKTILLVDDLISSGFSKEFAIKAIKDAGGIVNDLIVLVDRSEGKAKQWAEEHEVNLHALFTLSSDEILSQSD